MDTAHALLQADRVPGDVVIDHQPAELEIDTFSCCLGGDENLRGLAELALSIDAATGCIAVADFHTAMNHGEGQAPLAEFAHGAAILPVAGEIVERVFMLGEDEKLHLGITE